MPRNLPPRKLQRAKLTKQDRVKLTDWEVQALYEGIRHSTLPDKDKERLLVLLDKAIGVTITVESTV
jgi:hypothetical protein